MRSGKERAPSHGKGKEKGKSSPKGPTKSSPKGPTKSSPKGPTKSSSKGSKKSSRAGGKSSSLSAKATDTAVSTIASSAIASHRTRPTGSGRRTGKPVCGKAMKAVDEFIRSVVDMGIVGLQKEFTTLKTAPDTNASFDGFVANPTRNKFKDLVCIEDTRVKLTLDVPPETDYIHANWVNMTGVEKTFIATQAPLTETADDFWRMCYQESLKIILLLCNFFENGVMMFRQFWPETDGAEEYGNITIEVKQETKEDRIVTYVLELTYAEEKDKPLTVTLVQVVDWTGSSIAESSANILRIIRRVNKGDTCCVACINGVGRSAVVIACDVIITRLFKGQSVTIKDVVMELRSMRASAVRSASQYLLLTSTVLSYIKAKLPGKYDDDLATFRAGIEELAQKESAP